MNVTAWRIVKSRHAAGAFTGEGARLAGGRWNSRGAPMVYTAGSISLAMLEMLVHLRSEKTLQHYVVFEVIFEESLLSRLAVADLPRNWRQSPPPPGLQRIGDTWIAAARSPVLAVPGVIVPEESNYLLNPRHPEFHRLVIGPKRRVRFDPRLIGRATS